MPKETLKNLDRDAERFLFAGAQVARSDAALDAAKAKLGPLAAKAPAIAKVVEQIEKVQKATPKAAASEVLNLAALMAQVRGAQAAPLPAPEGDLAPLPKTDPIGSILAPIEITSLINALTNTGDVKHRPRIIADAVERDRVRDLRLLPYYVAALGDAGVGYVVKDRLLPKLGSLVAPELRASLNLQGRALDAKKLSVLAEIEGPASKPLLVEACEKGSPELRATAIHELSALDAAAAEPIAVKLATSDRSADVKRAAIRALAGATGDAALDLLFDVFLKSPEDRSTAGISLAAIKHPKATERALALLTPELYALGPFRAPHHGRADTKAKKAEVERLEKEHADKVELLDAILDLLAGRADDRTHKAVLGVFREHKIKDVRESAARSLLKGGYEGAFDELAPSVIKAGYDVKSEFIEGVIARDPGRAFERLGRFLDRATMKTKDQAEFAAMILGHIEASTDAEPSDDEAVTAEDAALTGSSIFRSDPRWVDAVIALLDHPDLQSEALDVIAVAKPPKALDAVLKIAGKAKRENAWNLLQVLVGYKDPRVAPLLIGFLDLLGGYWGRRTVYRAIRDYDDASLAPALAMWAKGKKRLESRDKDEIAEIVQFLERDRVLTAGV